MDRAGLRDRSLTTPELVVFEEENVSSLLEQIGRVGKHKGLQEERAGFFNWASFDSQKRFNEFKGARSARAIVSAYGEAEFKKKIVQLEKMIREQPERGFSYPSAGLFFGMGEPAGKLAFLFPGQGSQYIGMGGELARVYPVAEEVWGRLGEMSFSGKTIREVVFPPEPQNEEEAKAQAIRLAGADWTNPCISVVGEAILKLLKGMGLRPDAIASHSWGDISSFRAAGIISGVDMIRATRYRGELGVKCPTATRGCILAAYESAERIEALLSQHNIKEAWIANYNAPTVMVLSGVKEDIFRAHEVLEGEGINTQLIPISAAPHCPLAVPVSRDFATYLEGIDFQKAECDVYSYIFGRKVENDPERLKHTLWVQIQKPVRFIKQIENMHEDGIHTFVEVGPSDVLTNCVGQILEGKAHTAVSTDKRKEDSNLFFLNGVAELVREGRVQDLRILWEGYRVPEYPREDAEHDRTGGDGKSLKRLDLEFAKIEKLRSRNRA